MYCLLDEMIYERSKHVGDVYILIIKLRIDVVNLVGFNEIVIFIL